MEESNLKPRDSYFFLESFPDLRVSVREPAILTATFNGRERAEEVWRGQRTQPRDRQFSQTPQGVAL
jgi:hypothetical protein